MSQASRLVTFHISLSSLLPLYWATLLPEEPLLNTSGIISISIIKAEDIHPRGLCLCHVMHAVPGNGARQSRVCACLAEDLSQPTDIWSKGSLREFLSQIRWCWQEKGQNEFKLFVSVGLNLSVWEYLMTKSAMQRDNESPFSPAIPQAMVAKVSLCVAKSCYYM